MEALKPKTGKTAWAQVRCSEDLPDVPRRREISVEPWPSGALWGGNVCRASFSG